jgi:hypothetical protein
VLNGLWILHSTWVGERYTLKCGSRLEAGEGIGEGYLFGHTGSAKTNKNYIWKSMEEIWRDPCFIQIILGHLGSHSNRKFPPISTYHAEETVSQTCLLFSGLRLLCQCKNEHCYCSSNSSLFERLQSPNQPDEQPSSAMGRWRRLRIFPSLDLQK